MMRCLHNKQAFALVTDKGGLYICDQNPSCHFECRQADEFLFQQGIQAFFMVNTFHDLPKCCVDKSSGRRRHAKIRVVKDQAKPNFGRPFFVCPDKKCNYFEWGDVPIIQKPLCHHEKPCRLQIVKKEGPNKNRTFLCCAEQIGERCNFFEWSNEDEQ